MFKITATGSRADIDTAWQALAWSDPSPADAVDCKEETRTLWRLDAFAGDIDAAEACIEMIAASVPGLAAHAEPLPDLDWVKLSLEGLPAVEAGRFIVAGHHALTGKAPGKRKVLIEAGPAFGTGHHGTTLGCLLGLEAVARRRRIGKVLDIGTGTGVLAIAAIRAGAHRAIATDLDAVSVVTARQNSHANHCGRRLQIHAATGTRSVFVQRNAPYDTVLANILARPLIRLAPGIAPVIAPGGSVILSGLLRHQEPLVRAAYTGQGLTLIDRIHRDGWSTLVYHKAL